MKKGHNKIAVVVKYFYPVTAGIEMSIMQTYKLLAQRGWNVTIHTTNHTYTWNNLLPHHEEYEGLHIVRHNWMTFPFYLKLDSDLDAISLHNFNTLPHFFILMQVGISKLFNRKKLFVLLTPHGGYTPDWSFFNPIQASLKKLLHETVGSFLIRSSVDLVRAVSDWERLEIIKMGIDSQKVITITNGLEAEATMDIPSLASESIKKTVKDLGKYIIQVGRISEIKNLETSIRALSLTKIPIHFAIVGPVQDTNYEKKLKELIAQLHLESRVFFLGVINGIDKYYVIQHAQMLVHMSHMESFCNAVLEGMSQKLVCVVSNVGALPLLIQNNINGYTIKENDYKTLSRKIDFIMKNKKRNVIMEMEKRNQEFALGKTWNKIASQLETVYIDNINHI